jgi:ribosomal-protein-alanine N-acetyltransferase
MIMIDNFPTIETERFLLRQFKADDLENVYRGLSHPDVIKYYGISFDSLQATQEQLNWFVSLERENKGIWWAISSKNNQEFYGAGGLNDLSETNKKAEVGFWLLPDYWGRDIMREVMPYICNYGFQELNLHRIEGYVDSGNVNCKNALSKLDFKHEGTMVDCEFKDDKYISLEIYAMINPKHH